VQERMIRSIQSRRPSVGFGRRSFSCLDFALHSDARATLSETTL
jgi:hypothetical protein